MGLLIEKLSKLEHRLQTLIEEGTARILPIEGQRVNIGEKLIGAMQSSVQKDMTGEMIAICSRRSTTR